jgi:hypothetical protein
MPVTLEPISHFGFTPAFWNLPAVTPEGESIEYFTFSSRWDLRLLTDWELVAVQSAGMPATEQVIRLVHIEENDLPDEDQTGEVAVPSFPEEVKNAIGFSPAELDALIAWLHARAAPALDEAEGRRIFESVAVETLVRLGWSGNRFWTNSIGGQPHCYYLYHQPDWDTRDAATFTVVKLSGWTSQQYPGSAGKSLRFDTYTPERLTDIHEVQAKYAGGKEPVRWDEWSLYLGCGLGPTRFTPVGLGALMLLLERHRFPQSGP